MALDVLVCVCGSSLECVKVAQIRHKSRVLHLHVKAQVRLVASVKVKSVVPADSVKMNWKLVVQGFLENVAHKLFCCVQNFLSVCKAHFHINLGKFRLAVSAGILIAVTARNLEILVKSRNHQKLLVKLRRLRQRIEFSRMNTARNKVVARAFRS